MTRFHIEAARQEADEVNMFAIDNIDRDTAHDISKWLGERGFALNIHSLPETPTPETTANAN